MAQQYANPVTLENLRIRIDHLFKRLAKHGKQSEGVWDFHNNLYCRLEEHRGRGLDHEFWNFLVDELAKWRAIRGRPEHTKRAIRDAGLKLLPDLKYCFYRLAGKVTNELPTIETLVWSDVEPLFEVAAQIKKVSSPMFASKLCHFLVPSAYFVTDGELVKPEWNEYRHYWENCQASWLAQSEKEALKNALLMRMPVNCIPCSTYPWQTKITELCQFK
ncbi:MAG: hypothetical protein FPO08_04410 [Geobacter sp.]|nr:MAG: hypothetical protein FPO08_04410 [Geobacter sp.]